MARGDEAARHAAPAAADMCDVFAYNAEKVARLQEGLDRAADLAPLFKALADETRLRVIVALCQEEELCVCDVATLIGTSPATASHHLRLLRVMGVVACRRDGKMVYYRLVDPIVRRIVQEALALSNGTEGRESRAGHCR